MQDMVTVKIFTSRFEAEIAKGVLSVSNIKSFITADDEGGAYPYPMSPSTTGVKLLVQKDNYELAISLLDHKNQEGMQ